jgi:hypothetical protein
MNRFCPGTLFVIAITLTVFADADTRTVTADFERCHANMERFERDLRRYDDAVDRLGETAVKLGANSGNNIARELTALENRREYFHNRFERSRSQAEKLRGDLKNVGGPTCPSCVQSSVNMYCRMIETIQNEIDEYASKASDLQHRIGAKSRQAAVSPSAKSGDRDFKTRRLTIDSLYHSTTACGGAAAKTLHNQVKITLARADSLDRCNNSASALKSLDIADALLKKTSERCSDVK